MIHPKLSDLERERITQFYADIRKESNVAGGNQISVRHIESVLRMAEAHAKIHLRDYVRAEDTNFAMNMMIESFLQSQKNSVKIPLRKRLNKYLPQEHENFEVL